MSDEKTGQSSPSADGGDADQTVRVRVQIPPPQVEDDDLDSDITTNIRVADLEKAGLKPPAPPPRKTVAAQQAAIPVEEPEPPARTLSMGVLVGIGAVAGGALGFLIDKLSANAGVPWGLILGVLLGAGAGAFIGMRKP